MHSLFVSAVLMKAIMSALFLSRHKTASFLPENFVSAVKLTESVQVFSSSLMCVVFYRGTFTITIEHHSRLSAMSVSVFC